MKTYDEIAGDWDLWREYMDTGSVMTREEFDALSMSDRVDQLAACFGITP